MRISRSPALFLLACVLSTAFPGADAASTYLWSPGGTITRVRGTVLVRPANAEPSRPAATGFMVRGGETVVVLHGGEAEIRLRDGEVIVVAPGEQLTFISPFDTSRNGASTRRLGFTPIFSILKRLANFEVETSNVLALSQG